MNKRRIDVIMMLIVTNKSFLIFIAACSEIEKFKEKKMETFIRNYG